MAVYRFLVFIDHRSTFPAFSYIYVMFLLSCVIYIESVVFLLLFASLGLGFVYIVIILFMFRVHSFYRTHMCLLFKCVKASCLSIENIQTLDPFQDKLVFCRGYTYELPTIFSQVVIKCKF